VQTVTGGGFGGKEDYPSMLGSHVALLALKGKRPVKIVYDRAEDIAATTKRHPAVIRHKTGVMRDGTLVASQVDFDIDGGAYVTLSPVVLSRGLIHGVGAYRVPNVSIKARILATSTPPNGAFRGFGNPQATFGAERHIDKIAEVLGMDPLEIRRLNMLKEGDTTATGQTLDQSVGGTECLDTVLEKSRYQALQKEYAAFNAANAKSGSPLRRGVGLSFFCHGAGFTGNGEARIMGRADVELQEGGRVRIYTGCIDMGQGVGTTFPQLVSTELGLGLDAIEMSAADTRKVPDSGPTVASRTLMVVGKVVQQATR
jgi:CO/xanthine dehydrogenase Mo-binding subunit